MLCFVFWRHFLPLRGDFPSVCHPVWPDNGGSVFRSTWPLNRCWVVGLRRAAETCSGSVDLSIQTEPSITRMWQLCPWTPASSICSACACKNQPRSARSRWRLYLFRHLARFTFSRTNVSHFSRSRKTLFFSFVLFCFSKPLKRLEMFCAIIFNHMLPTQSWSHSHTFQVFPSGGTYSVRLQPWGGGVKTAYRSYLTQFLHQSHFFM